MFTIDALCGRICTVLRDVLAADPKAVTAILETRHSCRPEVESASPAVPSRDEAGNLVLGALGLINALVTPDWRIVAHYDEAGMVFDFTFRRAGE